MYCGNNQLDPRVVSGEMIIGTRYSCLRKGVGKGLRLSPYRDPYQPIFNERIYCGNKDRLPSGYSSFGSNVRCFQKGVGIGRTLNSSPSRRSPRRRSPRRSPRRHSPRRRSPHSPRRRSPPRHYRR